MLAWTAVRRSFNLDGDKSTTIWMVDGAYLFNAQKVVFPGFYFDYLKLRNKLEQHGDIHRAYYFNSIPDSPTDAQDAFHLWLKTARPTGPQMIVRLYDLKDMHITCPACGCTFDKKVQKGVDVSLATLLVKLAHQGNFETVIISSGDGDLLDAIRHIKENLNKRVELCVFRNGVAADLQSYADAIHWIDDFAEEVRK